MKETIEQISHRFYKSLPENDYYDLDSFLEFGFPDFLVQEIQIAVKEVIIDQVSLPSSKWVNIESEEIQQTKDLFLNAAYNKARLPAGDAQKIIRQSVRQIIEILIQPRKYIPQILFDKEDFLTKNELVERIKKVTVYKHFARVLIGYMDRKELSALSKVQCKK